MVIKKYYPKLISLIFIIFGLLNINDPDGFYWLVAYFLIALIPFVSPNIISNNKLKIFSIIILTLGILIGLGGLNSFMSIQIDDRMINMWEHQREGVGIILGSLWVWFSRRLITNSIK